MNKILNMFNRLDLHVCIMYINLIVSILLDTLFYSIIIYEN